MTFRTEFAQGKVDPVEAGKQGGQTGGSAGGSASSSGGSGAGQFAHGKVEYVPIRCCLLNVWELTLLIAQSRLVRREDLLKGVESVKLA